MSLKKRTLELLECNIDDLNPEILPFVMQKLLQANALDVWVTPCTMKDGRIGSVFSALCEEASLDRISEIIFKETSTLGLRHQQIQRLELERENVEVQTDIGNISVKIGYGQNGQILNIAPEYQSCKALALEHNIALKEVYALANSSARAMLSHRPDSSSNS